jgi:hypothetical protein
MYFQINEAQDTVQSHLQLIKGQLAEERAFVESELNSIEANFFAAEKDRVREK